MKPRILIIDYETNWQEFSKDFNSVQQIIIFLLQNIKQIKPEIRITNLGLKILFLSFEYNFKANIIMTISNKKLKVPCILYSVYFTFLQITHLLYSKD